MSGRDRLPLWPKLAWTAMVAVIVPLYWRQYGAANFLWFSDIALIAIALALWLESARLVSMMALAVLALELAWCLDLAAGGRLIGLAAYMFDADLPLWLRALSLFHIAIPPVLVWLLWRWGYDRGALSRQTLLAWIVLPASYLAGTRDDNINWVYGPAAPQQAVPELVYLAGLMAAVPLLVYLPGHLVLRRLFRSPASSHCGPAAPGGGSGSCSPS